MDNEIKEKKSIRESVLEKIKQGKISMRSKSYFIIRGASFAMVLILVFLTAVFIASFIIFTLKASGIWFLPRFGFWGIKMFLFSFPWLLFILVVLFIVVLELAIKHLSFVYRRPIIYSVLVVFVIILLGGFVLARTPLHGSLLKSARENRFSLPFAGQMYKGYCHFDVEGAAMGRIRKIGDSEMELETPDGQRIKIVMPSGTRFKGNEFNQRDIMMVMGDFQGPGAMKAREMRKIQEIQIQQLFKEDSGL